jgi:hypothetical protein
MTDRATPAARRSRLPKSVSPTSNEPWLSITLSVRGRWSASTIGSPAHACWRILGTVGGTRLRCASFLDLRRYGVRLPGRRAGLVGRCAGRVAGARVRRGKCRRRKDKCRDGDAVFHRVHRMLLSLVNNNQGSYSWFPKSSRVRRSHRSWLPVRRGIAGPTRSLLRFGRATADDSRRRINLRRFWRRSRRSSRIGCLRGRGRTDYRAVHRAAETIYNRADDQNRRNNSNYPSSRIPGSRA